MNVRDFDRFLTAKRCWIDGALTVESHAGQRQCPHCRRKWSYQNLQQRWAIADAFCKHHSRELAAQLTGTNPHTTGLLYRHFYDKLSPHFIWRLRSNSEDSYVHPERYLTSYKKIRQTKSQKKQLQLLVDLCLSELRMEARMDLVFRLVFQEKIQLRIRRAQVQRLRQLVAKQLPEV